MTHTRIAISHRSKFHLSSWVILFQSTNRFANPLSACNQCAANPRPCWKCVYVHICVLPVGQLGANFSFPPLAPLTPSQSVLELCPCCVILASKICATYPFPLEGFNFFHLFAFLEPTPPTTYGGMPTTGLNLAGNACGA